MYKIKGYLVGDLYSWESRKSFNTANEARDYGRTLESEKRLPQGTKYWKVVEVSRRINL